MRFEGSDVWNSNIKLIINWNQLMFIFCAKCELNISQALWRIFLASSSHVKRLMPMGFVHLYLRADSLIYNIFLFVLFSIKLILVDFHLVEMTLQGYFLFLKSVIWKVEIFHNFLDIVLTMLSHIDHFIQQSKDPFLILLQNISNSNHILAAVEQRVIKNEFQYFCKLSIAFTIFNLSRF